MRKRPWLTGILLTLLVVGVAFGQTLSEQVLQLLNRINTWTALQTFNAAISFPNAVPSVTSNKLYASGGNLFWNGAQVAGSGSATAPHNILSTTHADTTAATVVRGDLMTGQAASPLWQRLAIGAAGTVLRSDGTDISWATLVTAGVVPTSRLLTAGAGLTGGGDLTADRTFDVGAGTGITVNANDVALTVPVTAILGGTGQTVYVVGDLLQAATTTTLSRLAAVATGNVLLSGGVGVVSSWGKVNLAAGGHVTGNLPVTNLNSGTAAGATTFWRGDGTWAVPAGTAAGTVTSVALALPAIFTVSGSPVTTTGTLTGALATQTANTVFAGPTGGGAVAPTFRALVTADFPLTGVGAGTYTSITVDTSGRVTAGTTTQAAATTLTGQVAIANGGTGLAAIGDDAVWLGSAATTAAAATIPDCVGGALGYTQATNLFSCTASVVGAASVTTFTNKTYNAESAGNVLTVPFKDWLDTGYCQNATTVMEWSTPTTNPGVAACVTGANTQKLVIDFADGANTLSIQKQLKLPSDWSGNVDLQIWWYTTATAGNVVWQASTVCVANAETGDPAFSAASTVTDPAHGTTNQYNFATISALTVSTCAVDEILYLRVFRDPTDGSDTLAATARLVGVELTTRRAM
jgi:hypothetical protein